MLRVRLAALSAVLALGVGACAAGPSAEPAPPAAPSADTAALAGVQRDIIAAFRTGFLARDKSYADANRVIAEGRTAQLEGKAGQISQAAFDLELARIVALADNGHTHYNLGTILSQANRAPIRLAVFGEDFHVVRAAAPYHDLLGAKLVAIDGHAASALRDAGRSLWGGVAPWRDRAAYSLLESPELLNALGLAKGKASATYRFATASGTVDRVIVGDPPSTARPVAGPAQVMSPTPIALEDANWRTALDPSRAPWALQDWGKSFRWRASPEINGVVLDMRSTNTTADMKIADALKMFNEAIDTQKPTNLVLDLRLNSGGNLLTTRLFAKTLPERVPGRIFVLTGPGTFSAAISTTGYLKQAAPDRVFIVGEPVGDRMMFWAESPPYKLPVGPGLINLATERHDYADGCRAYSDCHFNVKMMPIILPTLAPDIAAPWTIEAYVAGRDPAMEAVAKALR